MTKNEYVKLYKIIKNKDVEITPYKGDNETILKNVKGTENCLIFSDQVFKIIQEIVKFKTANDIVFFSKKIAKHQMTPQDMDLLKHLSLEDFDYLQNEIKNTLPFDNVMMYKKFLENNSKLKLD